MTTEDIVRKFIDRHGDRYDYTCVEYISYYEKVKIGCVDHGYFYQAAHHHYDGKGCPSCAKSGSRLNRDRVLSDFNKVHGFEFIYDKFKYKNDYTKSIVTCRDHGDFSITPNSHKNGTKCPYCSQERVGFGRSKFIKCASRGGGIAVMYLIKVFDENEIFYKVGISTELRERFIRSPIPYGFEVLMVVEGDASLIWGMEKDVHRALFDFKYKPGKKFSGYRECFSINSIDVAKRLFNVNCTNKEIAQGFRDE